MPKVSIIVPVYNKADTLQRMVNSVKMQSFQNWEMKLIDDGSTDGSSEICDKITNEDCRISVIHKQNGGVSSARNVGIESAKGQYLMFLDADDKLEQDALVVMIRTIEVLKADLVIGGMKSEITDHASQKIFTHYQANRKNIVLPRSEIQSSFEELWKQNNMLSSCGKIYRLSVIRESNLRFNKDLIVLEDADFVLHFLLSCNTITSIKEIVYCVCDYVGRNSWQHRSRPDHANDVRYVYRETMEYFDSIGIPMDSSCRHVFDSEFRCAFNNLWRMHTSTKNEKKKKWDRIQSVLAWKEVQLVVENNKSRYSRVHFLCLKIGKILPLKIIEKIEKVVWKRLRKLERQKIL